MKVKMIKINLSEIFENMKTMKEMEKLSKNYICRNLEYNDSLQKKISSLN